MSDGKRPGGLTALAVINFVFAFSGVLGAISVFAGSALFESEMMQEATTAPSMSADDRKGLEDAKAALKDSHLKIHSALGAVAAGLLVVAGIGYLRQRRVAGRIVGNIWAVVSIVLSILAAVQLDPKIGGGFGLMFLVGILYPLLTLFFINVTFKDDLTT